MNAESLVPEVLSPRVPEDLSAYEEGVLSPRRKGEIYEQYLTSNSTLKELAVEHGVTLRELSAVAKKHGWMERRAVIELEELSKAESKFRAFILEKKLPTAQTHLDVSNMITEKIKEVVEQLVTATMNSKVQDKGIDMKLKRLAEALKAAGDIGARAVGLTDTPISDLVRQREAQVQKIPLVLINMDARGRQS